MRAKWESSIAEGSKAILVSQSTWEEIGKIVLTREHRVNTLSRAVGEDPSVRIQSCKWRRQSGILILWVHNLSNCSQVYGGTWFEKLKPYSCDLDILLTVKIDFLAHNFPLTLYICGSLVNTLWIIIIHVYQESVPYHLQLWKHSKCKIAKILKIIAVCTRW